MNQEPQAVAQTAHEQADHEKPNAATTQPRAETMSKKKQSINPVIPDDPTVVDRIVSAGLWTVGASWMVPMMGSLMAAQSVVDSEKVDWLSRIYTRGQVMLTGSKWRTVVSPKIDNDSQYMFFQNHVNHFDHVTLYNATPHFKQGLELEEHFKYPVYGWFMKQRGTIPVRRGSQGQTPEIMAHMKAELDRGHSILAFPEGTRTRTGNLGKFKRGVFHIARDLGVPIVPSTVTGMYRVMRKGSLIIRPGHEVTVYCDDPVETKGIPDSGIRDLMKHVHSVMSKRLDDYWQQEIEREAAEGPRGPLKRIFGTRK